jgi:hypothetical protein
METNRFTFTLAKIEREQLRLIAERSRLSEAEVIRRMIRRTAKELPLTTAAAAQAPTAPHHGAAI